MLRSVESATPILLSVSRSDTACRSSRRVRSCSSCAWRFSNAFSTVFSKTRRGTSRGSMAKMRDFSLAGGGASPSSRQMIRQASDLGADFSRRAKSSSAASATRTAGSSHTGGLSPSARDGNEAVVLAQVAQAYPGGTRVEVVEVRGHRRSRCQGKGSSPLLLTATCNILSPTFEEFRLIPDACSNSNTARRKVNDFPDTTSFGLRPRLEKST